MSRRFLSLLALLAGCAWLLPAEALAQNRFWLVNDSGRVIERAYVSSARVADWGPDILGEGVLPAGTRVWVTPNFRACVLDLRVTFPGGGEETRMGVNACALSQVVIGRGAGMAVTPPSVARPPAPAPVTSARPVPRNPSFHFVNGGERVIRGLQVSLSTDPSWGADRLGGTLLPPGGRLPVSLPAGGACSVDLRVELLDGRVLERRAVETCSVEELIWR